MLSNDRCVNHKYSCFGAVHSGCDVFIISVARILHLRLMSFPRTGRQWLRLVNLQFLADRQIVQIFSVYVATMSIRLRCGYIMCWRVGLPQHYQHKRLYWCCECIAVSMLDYFRLPHLSDIFVDGWLGDGWEVWKIKIANECEHEFNCYCVFGRGLCNRILMSWNHISYSDPDRYGFKALMCLESIICMSGWVIISIAWI